jgi:hypothetical protein
VAVTVRPTSTTVSFIEMRASLDPKSRWIMMGTAKVRCAVATAWQLQPWGDRKQQHGLANFMTFPP